MVASSYGIATCALGVCLLLPAHALGLPCMPHTQLLTPALPLLLPAATCGSTSTSRSSCPFLACWACAWWSAPASGCCASWARRRRASRQEPVQFAFAFCCCGGGEALSVKLGKEKKSEQASLAVDGVWCVSAFRGLAEPASRCCARLLLVSLHCVARRHCKLRRALPTFHLPAGLSCRCSPGAAMHLLPRCRSSWLRAWGSTALASTTLRRRASELRPLFEALLVQFAVWEYNVKEGK